MSKTIYSTISILLLTLFLSAFVFAQDKKSCTIEGTLTDADGKPAKNALVTIYSIKKRTNDKGFFSVSTVCGDKRIIISEIKGIPIVGAYTLLNSGQKLSISIKKLKDKYLIVDANNTILLSDLDQNNACEIFLVDGFTAMRKKLEDEFSTTVEDSYNQIWCEDKRQDLLKYRMLNPFGRSDLIAFISYYKNDLKREEDLAAIFNINIPGPKWPSGTLIDFIEAYSENEDLDVDSKKEYMNMIKFIRRFGAKKASEL